MEMNEDHIVKVAEDLNLRRWQVEATARLIADDATVPFIARYRKEVTGGLDEVAIISIRDQLEYLVTLDKRREAILKSLEDQGTLTDDLKAKVEAADTLAVLEDIYLPYRPKRRTRGTIAKEKGLEPLAAIMFEQGDIELVAEAAACVDPEKAVETVNDALAGARDIVAEWINEDSDARAALRELFTRSATLQSGVVKGKEEEGSKYKDYFEWKEPAVSAPSHRVLAIRRGSEEGVLTFHIVPDEEDAVALLDRRFIRGEGECAEQVMMAIRDSYKRLLSSSMETEIRLECKKRADAEAIAVFAENLRHLLLASPLGQKALLAVDPGYRTGCKIACLDSQGKLLHHDTIYPLEPHNQKDAAEGVVKECFETYGVDAIAVGNGTGGREAEAFCKKIQFSRPVTVVMVNESGASVYSASEVAREEFPDYDVTVRGAVSIGRRLMDPLAELVKIDPKSIGVGQYQHDVDQKALKKSLDDVVESCVNAVGVEVNTASKQLLGYVSGLSERLAGAVVAYRNDNGPFRSRSEFMGVPGVGPKTFEQAAGFLRILGAENPLDASAVHPESYPIVEAMAQDHGCTVADLIHNPALRSRVDLKGYITDAVGMPTLTDIMEELAKPGRDPRQQFELFTFTDGIHEISDLEEGMQMPGVVTNVTAFGAFVDIGVHQDGLVHLSEMSERFVKNPHDIVTANQKVRVTVIGIDEKRSRISLSMRENPSEPRGKPKAQQKKEKAPHRAIPQNSKSKKAKQSRNPFTNALKDWKPSKS